MVADDPWDGQTLEWTTTSPPPAGNFAEWVGEVSSPEPLLDRKQTKRAKPIGRGLGVMLQLPPAPSPARPRSLLVATALVCAAGLMLFGGMLALYLGFRDQAGNSTDRGCPGAWRSPTSPSTSCWSRWSAAA